MHKFKWLFIIAFVIISTQQLGAQCNHRHSFDRSPVADSIDAIHYRIEIQNIDFVLKKIKAKTTIQLRPKVTISQIPLELKALAVDSVKMNGQSLLFSQQGDILRIATGQSFQADDTLQFSIYYSGVPFHEQWGGFHFSGNYAFNLGVGFVSDPHNLGKAWFPCVDDFQDRATYEVLVTLPDALTGIAGGLLIETINNGNGTKTWHWKLDQNIPTYLASVAAGNYALTSSSYQGLNATLPITIYSRPADTLKVVGSFANLQQILANYENRFGPYPFDRVGYTSTAIGAMEHVTNISYPHSAINGTLSSEYLLSHELSHMWFGNLVTCSNAGDMWLNEGWATFCHHFFQYDLYSAANYRSVMNENHYDVLKNAHITDGSYLSLHNVPTEYTYGATVYDKGATVVHTLMNYLGQDVFFDAVRTYLQHFAFNSADSYDMRDFLSNHTGVDLTAFFDAWVFTPGTPGFSIDSMSVVPTGNQFKAHVYVKQKYKGAEYLANDNILEITFVGADWQKFTDTIHFSGKTSHRTKVLDFEPVLVLPDFYDKTADATNDIDGVLKTTGEIVHSKLNFRLLVDALPDSAFYRISHHWVAPDSLKQAIPGLRLSPYRHWVFTGIFAENTQMRARFFYSNTNSLDGSLIRTEQDSVVVLYRPDAAHDWQIIPQTRIGIWSVGNIEIENCLPGQYTFGAWDTQIVGIKTSQNTKILKKLNADPNPSSHMLRLSWDEDQSGQLIVLDSSGKTVLNQVLQDQSAFLIQTDSWSKGVYLADFRLENGQSYGYTRFIIQ